MVVHDGVSGQHTVSCSYSYSCSCSYSYSHSCSYSYSFILHDAEK